MNQDELNEVGEAFTQMIAESPTLKNLLLQLGRLVSHLESERRTTDETLNMLKHHQQVLYGDLDDETRPGLVSKVNMMWKWRQWLLGTSSAAAGAILTLVAKHFFP